MMLDPISRRSRAKANGMHSASRISTAVTRSSMIERLDSYTGWEDSRAAAASDSA